MLEVKLVRLALTSWLLMVAVTPLLLLLLVTLVASLATKPVKVTVAPPVPLV